ncbi:MAG: hypothetical protein KQJ78_08535 [Deltaproteobacteria bacterium]|nr:hypothetical protein [Deltaproteobacteria bacterium]
MQLSVLIKQAQTLADRFIAQGHKNVRLPAYDFDDWREVYDRPGTGDTLNEFRSQQKMNWYLTRLLRASGVAVDPVPVRTAAFAAWCQDTGHELTDAHARGHAVGEYVNDPAVAPADCAHAYPELEVSPGEALATITVFGESEEQPEVLTVTLHLPDGQVLTALEILAVEHTPQEAWDLVRQFLDHHHPQNVFHDQNVRRPEYCADCGALLANVANPAECIRLNI